MEGGREREGFKKNMLLCVSFLIKRGVFQSDERLIRSFPCNIKI